MRYLITHKTRGQCWEQTEGLALSTAIFTSDTILTIGGGTAFKFPDPGGAGCFPEPAPSLGNNSSQKT